MSDSKDSKKRRDPRHDMLAIKAARLARKTKRDVDEHDEDLDEDLNQLDLSPTIVHALRTQNKK